MAYIVIASMAGSFPRGRELPNDVSREQIDWWLTTGAIIHSDDAVEVTDNVATPSRQLWGPEDLENLRRPEESPKLATPKVDSVETPTAPANPATPPVNKDLTDEELMELDLPSIEKLKVDHLKRYAHLIKAEINGLVSRVQIIEAIKTQLAAISDQA